MGKMVNKYKVVSPDILNDDTLTGITYEVINKVVKYSRLDILSLKELDILQTFLESEGAEFHEKLKNLVIDEELEVFLIKLTEYNVKEHIKLVRKKWVNTRTEKDKKKRIRFNCSFCDKSFDTALELKDHILNNHEKFKKGKSEATIIGGAILKSYRHKVKKKKNKNKDFTSPEDAIWFRYPGSYESNT